VGGDLRDPVQGKVSIEVRVHLRAVRHGRKIQLAATEDSRAI